MTTSATQSGVPTDKPVDGAPQDTPSGKTDEIQPQPTEREKAMDLIAANNDARTLAEMNTETGAQAGATDAGGKPDAQLDDQLGAQLETPTVLSTGLDKVLVKVKIDGVEQEVSVEEMQRQFQKNGAADKRLAEATQLLKEAKAATTATVIPPVGIENNGNGEDSSAIDSKTKVSDRNKKLVSALFEGDEEKALEALEEFGAGRPQPTLDTDQLAAQLTPAVKQQLVVESALEQFALDHADIVSDPHLADMADGFLAAEVEDGKSFVEALKTAAQKTHDWLTSKGIKTAEPASTTTRDQKLERKKGIDPIPALHTKATVQEEPVETASDIIAGMRKQRGLDA